MRLVVKIGGSLMKDGIPEKLLDDVKTLAGANEIVLVHGGGETVTAFATRLGKEQKFVVSPEGLRSRYTDRETADIYSMVMSGLLATRIVLALAARGVRAVSVSGTDGRLLAGKRKKKLVVKDDRGRKLMIEGGYTGKVEAVNSALPELLLSGGYVPIVSPVAISEEDEPLNIDGDRAASSLAAGMKADAVLFLTNVDGLILNDGLVERLTPDEARMLLPEIGFGMQKKVLAAVEATSSGVKEAIICSGTRDSPLASALAHSGCTVIA